MKSVLKFLLLFCCLALFWIPEVKGQLTAWQYASVLEISEHQGITYTNEQFLFHINTADLVSNGLMQPSGADIRFSTDCEGVNLLKYYIESGMNTTDTRIWVLVPEVLPYSVTKIYFFSGNPAASPATDFSGTFPSTLIITAPTVTTLFASLDYDWFEVQPGATVNLIDGVGLTINSNKIKIDGFINGVGKGAAGGLAGGNAGSGSGGGTGSANAGDGASGGGYGGNGGLGGYNTSPASPAGSTYGSATSVGIQMGSGGGGGIDSTGGNGGGMLTLTGFDVEISGVLNVSGLSGKIDTANQQGTGGGSGGGILIQARELSVSGQAIANGGNGGSDPTLTPGFGGGGGGGGGRIKAFYSNSASLSGTFSVNGGTGGCCGTTASQNGASGSIHTEKTSELYAVTMSPMIYRQSPDIYGPDTVCVSTTATYFSSVIAGVTYHWTVSGGTINQGQSTNQIEVTWSAAGSQMVTLITTNVFLGCSDTTSYTVFVSGTVPVPDFTFSAACVGLPTQFRDSTTGNVATYSWSFGDGNTSSTKDPQHTYLAAGSYTVTLEVISPLGCRASVSKTVTVDALPDASFTASAICQGAAASFNGVAGGAVYTWDFGDGGSGSGVSTTHTYVAAGTYTVMLFVSTTNGCVSSSSAPVTVYPSPVPDFDFTNACTGDNVVFTNTSSISSGTLSYQWDFGDAAGSSAQHPTHAYASAGVYNVKLTATSAQGCVDSIIKAVTAYAIPVADFNVSPACLGTSSQFINTSTLSAGFMIYNWDFGDGSSTSNLTHPMHNYQADGAYTVTLTVTSDKGCNDVISKTAVVYPGAMAAFSAANVCFGDSVSFQDSSSGPGLTYQWNFGDGNFSSSVNPKHLYFSAGTYTVALTVTTSDGCVASAQQDVVVYPMPAANFTAPNVCEGRSTQFVNTSSLTGGQMNFSWNFGDGNVSVLDNPLHQYADTGTYSVTLIVTSDNGCRDTVVKPVSVLLQPIADFDILPACFGFNNVVIDNSTGYDSAAYYQLDFYNNGSYDAGPFSPGNASVNVAAVGDIATRIRITNQNGCTDSIVKTLRVNAFPVADYNAPDVCFGEPVLFTNATWSVDSNLLGALAYQWDFGDGSSSTDINPTHVYDSSGIFTVTLIANSSEGCADTFSNTLIVYPLPDADFSTAIACFNKDVLFSNLTTIAFGTVTYNWHFGDNGTDTATNPIHVYSSIGIYQVELTATSDAGCVDIITKDLTVYPTPTANFIATEVCENDTTRFTNLSSIASGALSYVWDFGDSFNSIDEEPSHVYGTGGVFSVTLTAISDSGCTDTKTRNVIVHDMPDITFTASNVCDGDTVFFTNTTQINDGSILYNIWNFGDGGASFDKNTYHVYDAPGTYAVSLVIQTDKNCRDSLVQAVIVHQLPEVVIIPQSIVTFCEGGSVDLVAQPFPVTRTYTYQWNTNEVTQSITVSTSGIYCVTATDQFGCVDDTCQEVIVWPLPVVTAGPDTTVSKGYPVQLFATGGISYQWTADPPDPTLNITEQNPLVTPLVTTTYTVLVTDSNGCQNTATVVVNVEEDYLLRATTVITPNGDGKNDYWFVENILTYPDAEVLIFDRWGTLVYQRKGYDNSWDGTHDGKELPQGTYFYVIKFEASSKIYKGAVSVLR
ncbi:MAG: hypothetical protein KatS3mg031_1039 [Chitinophagales bacterium]|nr:MAG: hypothetical protein KatS3mg031_1039 [Chitinophagales bacterium]